MTKTSPWASLYFILLMTFGNYFITNLLVAIIVDGFVEVFLYFFFKKKISKLIDLILYPKGRNQ